MWECKYCQRKLEDEDASCWSCGKKREDAELLKGHVPEPVSMTWIKNPRRKTFSKRKRSPAFSVGLVMTIIGLGGWLIATIAGNSIDRRVLMACFFQSLDDNAPGWYYLMVYAKMYGIYVGIAGIVLWVVGMSIDKNKQK